MGLGSTPTIAPASIPKLGKERKKRERLDWKLPHPLLDPVSPDRVAASTSGLF